MTNPSGAAGSAAGTNIAAGLKPPAPPANLFADAMDFAMQFATIPGPPGSQTSIGDLISNAEAIHEFISRK